MTRKYGFLGGPHYEAICVSLNVEKFRSFLRPEPQPETLTEGIGSWAKKIWLASISLHHHLEECCKSGCTGE